MFRDLANSLPEAYKTHPQFINCIEYLNNREFALALESLVELASETEHKFSKSFWQQLAEAANQMGLTDEASYCNAQVNQKENRQ